MKRYLVAAMLFTMPMFSARAQGPRCASVLRVYSPEKVDKTLEDLARLTLEVDLARAQGSKSILNPGLQNKNQDVMTALSLSREELRRELAPRIARLQKQVMKEDATRKARVQDERDTIGKKIPRYVHVETRQTGADMGEGLIGVTDVINGSKKVLYRAISEDSNFWDVMSYDLKSGKTELVVANISTAAVHADTNRLITFTSNEDANGTIVSTLHFYSLSNLKPEASPLEIKWSQAIQKIANNVARQLVLSEDGNTFIVRSNEGVVIGDTRNPLSATFVKPFNIIDVLFTSSHEFLLADNFKNTVTKYDLHNIWAPKESPKIQSGDRIGNLLRVDKDRVAAMTADGFNTFELSTMADDGFTAHEMRNKFAPIPYGPFYVGIEVGGLVLKQLDMFTADSLVPMRPQEMKNVDVKELVLSSDGKTLVVFSRSSNNLFISVFE